MTDYYAHKKTFDIFAGLLGGRITRIHLTGGTIDCPAGTKWLILNGIFNHVTGTLTAFAIKDIKTVTSWWTNYILGATGSGFYQFFSDDTSAGTAWRPLVLDEEMQLFLSGGTGVYVELTMLEWVEDISYWLQKLTILQRIITPQRKRRIIVRR